MILDVVVGSLLAVVKTIVVAVLPATTVSVGTATGFIHWYSWLNGWLPLSEALTCWVALTGLATIVAAYRVSTNLWGQVPVIGGHG